MGTIKKLPLVYLVWCDAISNQNTWLDSEEAKEWGDNEEWLVAEVGFILKETEDYLLLVARHHPDSEDGTDTVDGVMKIPKCWIRKRKSLRY